MNNTQADAADTNELAAFQQWWKEEYGDRVPTDNQVRAFLGGLRYREPSEAEPVEHAATLKARTLTLLKSLQAFAQSGQPFMYPLGSLHEINKVIDALSADHSVDANKMVTPIIWTLNGDKKCGYNNWVGETSFGRILITWKGWKEDIAASTTVDEFPGEYFTACGMPDEVKAACEVEFMRRLRLATSSCASATEPVALSPAQLQRVIACVRLCARQGREEALQKDRESRTQLLAEARELNAIAVILETSAAHPAPQACQGANCGATDGKSHSRECIEEAAKSQGWTPTEADFVNCPQATAEPVADSRALFGRMAAMLSPIPRNSRIDNKGRYVDNRLQAAWEACRLLTVSPWTKEAQPETAPASPTLTEAEASASECPWCGMTGTGFEDSPCPADYCGHDPALSAPASAPVAEPAKVGHHLIRSVFMQHGFTIKEGQSDLKPYVYEAAEALLTEAAAWRGEVAEPVGEVGTMPGTSGFTMACFKASDVPVGTKLYTHSSTVAEEAKDAARYRWLVENVSSGSLGFACDFWINADGLISEWNARIDAAMASGEAQ